MATKLSVNVNKIATLRNARGGNLPNLVQVAIDCELFGADGITVHPRPDERHITTQDTFDLAKVVKTEYNIEGYPDERFLDLIDKIRPAQATLVPDPPNVLTSDAGWDTVKHADWLKDLIKTIQSMGVRTSIFIETDRALIEGAASIGTDRIEFYTGTYAANFHADKAKAIAPYKAAAEIALKNGLALNAGHDLNLDNLNYFISEIPAIDEVSIGHALVADALYLGLENTVRMYKQALIIQ
ncbi:pyridoxine 5'-phosphate synthase [Crocinitomix catalasitica]|uniref:pyridoxine 5'-phosphate synthase n=1 Tax=Crocinitomix catalasitica TaxID=184607 RepID=UPI0004866F09|nr:pyridoxine 5'-phosphate synthase [Crocinitomix catalasitica]